MEDRVSTYPGRVTLTPVPGQTNKYDLTMADEPTQEGTPPIKANLLTDTVAALWGGDPSSKVTDILKYAAARYGACATAATTAAKVVTLSDFALSVGAVIGVAFTNANTAASPTLNVNGTGAKAIYFNGAVVGASQVPKMAYLQYDGTYWQILNAPLVQIATGSYSGAGVSGSSNQNSLTFNFPPKIIFIGAYVSSYYETVALLIPSASSGGSLVSSGSSPYTPLYVSISGATVHWYARGGGGIAQMNESGISYKHVAIG